MAGVTIDHMVAFVLLIVVITASIGVYSQIIDSAIAYQNNHKVAMKAAELANTLLLSAGDPSTWGLSNITPYAFGLQDPDVGGYSLSTYSLARLRSANQALVYYYKTGQWYSNNSLGGGGVFFLPVSNAINYTTASQLLGVNGSYAFRLTVTPILTVSVTEVNLNPLRLRVDVRGPGLAVASASLNYILVYAVPKGGTFPSFDYFSGTSQTNSSGSALLQFSTVNGLQYAYSVLVYASVGGLTGVGYHTRQTIVNNGILPFVENFQTRTIILAHSFDVHTYEPPVSALHYNSTYLALTQNFQLREIQMSNGSGLSRSGTINYGEGKPYFRVQIPISGAGILLVAYRWGNDFGIVMMPWGISTLGFSVAFGGDPTNADWVATELRQVTVNRVAYQVQLSVWSVKGYQPWRFNL